MNGRISMRPVRESAFEFIAEFEFTDDMRAFWESGHFLKAYPQDRYEMKMERMTLFDGWVTEMIRPIVRED